MSLSTVYSGLVIVTILSLRAVIMGLRAALLRTDIPLQKGRIITLAVAVGILVWLGFTGFLAQSGFLANWEARPERIPLVPLFALLVLIAINRTPIFAKFLKATPRYWIVGMQTFRIFVELCFFGLFKAGVAPQLVTFEGNNFDILVGISAPFVAFAIYKFNLGARAVIVWNTLGLGILINTIFVLITAHPGALHIDRGGQTFTAFATWPFIWIPAFLAPLAVFLHLFSIRQNAMLLQGELK